MNLINKLERKFGRYAITNLNVYLVIIYLIGIMIMMTKPLFYYQFLSLDINRILHGEIWRIATFIFYPPVYDSFIILPLLAIYFYYTFTRDLIMVWGDFKFNLYILIGMLGHFIGGLIVSLISHTNVVLEPTYLTFSIFIAFALTFPDTIFLLFFILPIKAKYLAYFELALYLLIFFTSNINSKIAILCSLLNVLIFLYITYKYDLKYFIKRMFKR